MLVKAKMKVKAFERIAARLGPCELVRGEVEQMSPGGLSHGGASFRIAQLLGNWADGRRCGRVVVGEVGIITERDPDTVRGADVAYFSFKRLPNSKLPDSFTDVPPDLVVEVVGRGQSWNRMIAKAAEYLAMGVNRVWIVDARKQSVTVVRPDQEPQVLAATATLSDADVLPGFRCKVRQLFE